MGRAETVKSYLQAGKSVCPFAKASPLELITTSAITRVDRAAVGQGVASFAAARGNALVLLASADDDFATTTAWATETFLELMICCTRFDQPTIPIAEIEQYVERVIRPTLGSAEIRPYLGLRAKALMTICMAPVYPAAHPRHAPHTILVVTWSDDVAAAAAQSVGAVSKIRAAMAKEHGCVYDADELMLPLPGTSSRKLKMWIGNLDGSRQGLVIASTKERARKIVGTGRSDFDDHWTEQPRIYPALDPEILYTRPIDRRPADAVPWYRGRCPPCDRPSR
jgi:hypothetical protein